MLLAAFADLLSQSVFMNGTQGECKDFDVVSGLLTRRYDHYLLQTCGRCIIFHFLSLSGDAMRRSYILLNECALRKDTLASIMTY